MRSSFFTYIGAIVLMCMSYSCKNDPAEVESITRRDSFPLLTTHDVKFLYTDSARPKIRLKADVVEDHGTQIGKTVFPKGVFVEFYDDSSKVNSSLKADYAERRTREQIMVAKKNVEVVNIKGEKLNTEKLTWDGRPGQRKIYTDGFVKITQGNQVITGNGLESDETFTNYTITDITGTFLLNEKE